MVGSAADGAAVGGTTVAGATLVGMSVGAAGATGAIPADEHAANISSMTQFRTTARLNMMTSPAL